MRICFLGNATKGHTRRWAEWLAGEGHRVRIITDVCPEGASAPAGVEVVRPVWPRWLATWTFHLRGGRHANARDKWRVYTPLVHEFAPHVVHAHEALTYGPVLEQLGDYPRVLTAWGPDVERLATRPDGEPSRLVRRALHAADVITTNGPGLEEAWSTMAGIPTDRFRLFPWGIDTGLFAPAGEVAQLALRERLAIPVEAPVILSPRLAKPYYRIDVLLEAWRHVRQAAPAAWLVVLRAGATDRHWEALRRRVPRPDEARIRFVDEYLAPTAMASLYSLSAGVVMIPRTDLLALSLLESARCGALPVLAPLPCYRKAAIDLGEEAAPGKLRGVFVEEVSPRSVAHALRRVLALSDTERQAHGRHNVDVVGAHFEWRQTAPRILDVYTEAINRSWARRHGP